jgi:hypothetical protein
MRQSGAPWMREPLLALALRAEDARLAVGVTRHHVAEVAHVLAVGSLELLEPDEVACQILGVRVD